MITDLKPYHAMKDSGVEWLGAVPAHWCIKRGKCLFKCIDVRSETGKEELLTVSSNRGVLPRRTANVTMFKAESYSGHKLCWPDDLVINSLWAWAGGLGVSNYHGIISTAYSVYRPLNSVDPGFIHELVRSSPFQWELRVRSKGVWTSRLQMTDDSFLCAPFPLPPASEQDAIVKYLNYMDRRVRRLVQAKRKLIALFAEQKQAIIHRAVTRGLDPDVPLKDSGVEWLGKVPAHWGVTRLKFVASKIIDCLHATPRYSSHGIFPAIRTADISAGVVHLSSARRLSEAEYHLWTERLEPETGDILYSREGERFGIAACVPPNTKLCISQRMMIFRIRSENNPAFVMWLLNSPVVYAQASQDVMGATAPHVNISTIRNYVLALPPKPEQDAIVKQIDQSTSKFTELIANAQCEIERLNEYRTRLIADVVTGKLDVRAAAAALPEVDPLAVNDETDEMFDGDAEADLDEMEAMAEEGGG